MKTTLLLFAMFLLAAVATAQSTKIELFDLVKILSPDSTGSDNSTSWSGKSATAREIKWKSAMPDKGFTKIGTAAVLVKGKAIKCASAEGGGGSCKWDVYLNGTKTKYTSFTLEANNLEFLDHNINMIDYFFDKSKSKLKATLLKKNTDGVIQWWYEFLLQIPEKKDMWLRIVYMSQTATASQAENSNNTDLFHLDFYIDKMSFDKAALY